MCALAVDAHDPFHRVTGLRRGAGPAAHRLEQHLTVVQRLGLRTHGGVAKRAAIPQRLARLVTQAKGRQGAAVEQIHADPVPAHRLGMHQRLAPFVVHPGRALHRQRSAFDRQGAADLKLRQAVVEARLPLVWPFDGEPPIALQQQRLRFLQAQLESKSATRGARLVMRGLALERPVAQGDGGVLRAGLRHLKTLARNALVVPQLFARDVGHGGMRKDQLFGGKR